MAEDGKIRPIRDRREISLIGIRSVNHLDRNRSEHPEHLRALDRRPPKSHDQAQPNLPPFE